MTNIPPDVLKRYAENKATAAERLLVENWLENEDDFSNIDLSPDDSVVKEVLWKGLVDKAEQKRKVYRLKSTCYGLVAASLLVFAGAFIFNRNTAHDLIKQPIAFKTYQVPKGNTATLILNDGTNVKLAGGSSFRYPDHFSGQTREVTLLSGEAFFNVKHNQKQPFKVHTSDAVVSVLGTRFNISNAAGSNQLAVTLTEGSISFKGKNQSETLLVPGQQLVFNKRLNKIQQIGQIDTSYATSWTNDVLWFRNSAFKEVIEKLEIYYGVTFKTEGNPDLNVPFTGKFKRQPLSRILKLIENSSDLRFKQEQNKVIIY